MAKAYWEKLKDPRWQRKRLEAMARAEFACEICQDNESTLNVHHKEYFKGREPWDYDLKQLAVLCETCHGEHHASDDRLKMACSMLSMDGPLSRDSMADVICGYANLELLKGADHFAVLAGAIGRCIGGNYGNNIHDVMLVAGACERDGQKVFDLLLAHARAMGGE